MNNATQPNQDSIIGFSRFSGCGAKLRLSELRTIIDELIDTVRSSPSSFDAKALPDVAFFELENNIFLASSVDVISPIVGNAEDFGAIATAHALADLYSVGSVPIFGLNIMAIPDNFSAIHAKQIVNGAQKKAAEAGFSILGGHTFQCPELFFGAAVIGMVKNGKKLKKSDPKDGDVIICTKPLGAAQVATTHDRLMGLNISETEYKEALEIMLQLDQKAADIAYNIGISSCTDVSGFGFIGHLHNILEATQLEAEIKVSDIPILEAALKLSGKETRYCLGIFNKNDLDCYVKTLYKVDQNRVRLLFEGQTSGGLLFTISPKTAKKLVYELKENGFPSAAIVGTINKQKEKNEQKIILTP